MDWSVGVGRGRGSVKEAAHGLEEAIQVAETVATFDTRARPFYRFADVRLRGLLALMHADARLKSFAEAELAGILDPPDEPALELLGLYLKHGGNKSALARTGFLSRPALYAPAGKAGGQARFQPRGRRIADLFARGLALARVGQRLSEASGRRTGGVAAR